MAMAEQEQRATFDSSGASQAETMANQSSKNYLRHTRRHNIDYSKVEAEALDEDEDKDEDDEAYTLDVDFFCLTV